MNRIKIKCSKCGKKLASYIAGSKRYNKSPVKKCKRCGTIYRDPRYEELAIVGIPQDQFRITGYVIVIILGTLFLYRGIHLLPYHLVGIPAQVQWNMPLFFIIIGGILIFAGAMEILSIKIGWKRKMFERWMRDSEQRLSDKRYAYLLRSLGYEVPETYL